MENVKKGGKILFMPSLKVQLSLHWHSWNKQLLGSITWWSAVQRITWSVNKCGKYGWKFIYAFMQHMTVIETSVCWTAVSKQLLLYQILWKSNKPVSCYRQRDWWMVV